MKETYGPFVPVDKTNRLYRPRLRGRAKPLAAMLNTSPLHAVEPAHATPRRQDAYGDIHQRLLEGYAPPSVVVDDHNEIVHLSNSASQFLQFRACQPALNLVNAVHPALRLDVRTALHQAFESMTRVQARRIAMSRPAGTSY